MGQPTFNQITFRIRDDDGDETGATWLAGQGADYSMDVDTNFRVRFLIDEQNVKAWSGLTFAVYYDIDGGGYSAVTGSSPIQYAATGTGNYTDNDDCTEQLTGGTGTFVSNNNGMQSNSNDCTNTGAINQYFEMEVCFTIDSAQVSNGQSITLHVYEGGAEINSYVDSPVITVVEVETLTINKAESITVGDTDSEDPISISDSSSESVSVADTPQYYPDEIIVSESITVSLVETGFSPSVSDSVTVDDTASVVLPDALAVNVSDSITAGESVSASVSAPQISESESVSVSDAPSASIVTEISKSESVSVGDTDAETVSSPAVDVSDGVAVDETVAEEISLEVSVSESVSAIDSTQEFLVNFVVEKSESVPVSDATSEQVSAPQIDVFDPVSVADTPTVNVAGFETRNVNVFDSVSLSDTPSVEIQTLVNVSDSVLLSETVSENIVTEIASSESVSVADSGSAAVQEVGTLQVNVSDSVSVADSSSETVSTSQVAASDTVSVSDTPSIEIETLVSVSETVSVADNNSQAVSDLEVSKSESVSVSDSPSASVGAPGGLSISVTDTVSISENVSEIVSDLEVSTSDSVSASDTPTVSVQSVGTLSVSKSESVTVSDSNTVSASSLEISVSETISLSDSPNVSVLGAGELAISVSESISLSDLPSDAISDIQIDVSSSVSVSDSPYANAGGVFTISVSETITVSDAVYVSFVRTTSISIQVGPIRAPFQSPFRGTKFKYAHILQSTYGANEVWPLTNLKAGVAPAYVNVASNGTYSGGITPNAIGGPVPGASSPLSDGEYGSKIELLTDQFISDWNLHIGSISVWIRGSAGIWYDYQVDQPLVFGEQFHANVNIIKYSYNSPNQFATRVIINNAIYWNLLPTSTYDWFHVGISWKDGSSGSESKTFLDGVQVGNTLNSSQIWDEEREKIDSADILHLQEIYTWFGSAAYVAVKYGSIWEPADFKGIYDAAFVSAPD